MMFFNKSKFAFLLTFVLLPENYDCFVPNHGQQQLGGGGGGAATRSSRTQIFESLDDELGNLEEMRAAFEKLMRDEEPMHGNHPPSNSIHGVPQHQAPPPYQSHPYVHEQIDPSSPYRPSSPVSPPPIPVTRKGQPMHPPSSPSSNGLNYNDISQKNNNAIKGPPTAKEDYIPIITEASKRRRELEMELIASLETSDDAIEEIVNFWLVERDHEAAMKMKEMEQYCSPGHEREEKFLRQTIHEYGCHWVEPISRLALLMYADGRSDECEYWCHVALAVKPWHFEVVQTLIMNSMKQNDEQKTNYWMERSLPSLAEEPEKRKLWVQNAIQDAKDAVTRAKQAKDNHAREQQLKAIARAEPRYIDITPWQPSAQQQQLPSSPMPSNDDLWQNNDDAWQ